MLPYWPDRWGGVAGRACGSRRQTRWSPPAVGSIPTRPTSDVDLLVAPGPDTTLFDLSGFALDGEEIVGRHVDVATPRGLKARIQDRVLAEAIAPDCRLCASGG
jgi:hypothetical protein